MKILLVDDNNDRVREITAAMKSAEFQNKVTVHYATSKQEAIKKMGEAFYELVVVDLLIPEFAYSATPDKETGIKLINEINLTNRINPPFQIVAMTIDSELYQEKKDCLSDKMIPLLLYTKNSSWINPLKEVIKRGIVLSNSYNRAEDVVILTAVEEEYNAVLNLDIDWKNDSRRNEIGRIKIGKIKCGETEISIVAAMLPLMGLVSAATYTTLLIERYHPKLICMVGICAGIDKSKVNLGDIVVATMSWDYGNGKIKSNKDGYMYDFEAAPMQVKASDDIIQSVRNCSETHFEAVVNQWNIDNKQSVSSKIYMEAMPSGASVVQDSKMIDRIVKPQHRKSIAIDMETYAVYYACENNRQKPAFLSIKGVVDYADENKNDDYHDFCSAISSRFLYELLKSGELACLFE